MCMQQYRQRAEDQNGPDQFRPAAVLHGSSQESLTFQQFTVLGTRASAIVGGSHSNRLSFTRGHLFATIESSQLGKDRHQWPRSIPCSLNRAIGDVLILRHFRYTRTTTGGSNG